MNEIDRRRQNILLKDFSAGLNVALVSIPEGMAYAIVAGVNPVFGLYTGMVTTIVASLTGSTSRLIVTLTNALALVAGEQLSRLDTDDPARALFTLTLLVGVFMTLLGALRLGGVVRFVSREVMSGFIFATALLIVMGQYKDLVGYSPSIDGNKFAKAVDITMNMDSWHADTLIVGLASIALLVALKMTSIRALADILIIGFSTLLVMVFGWHGVEIVGDISEVPNGLGAIPMPVMPDLSMIPVLLGGALAATVVGLSESSGVGTAYPNRDGKRADMSRDFLGQGLGNLAGAFFQALPAGGSLSRTAINVSGGAQTRMSGVFSGLLMAISIFLFGSAAEAIPLAGLAALLIVIGFGVMFREGREIALAWKTFRLNTTIAIISIAVGVFVDLTAAIFAGVIMSLLTFAVTAATQVRVVEIFRDENGEWAEQEMSDDVAAGQTLVLELRGNPFFASVYAFDAIFPSADALHGITLIFRARDLELRSLTGLGWLEDYANRLKSKGSRLVVTDVGEAEMEILRKTGAMSVLGEESIFPAEKRLFGALEKALRVQGLSQV